MHPSIDAVLDILRQQIVDIEVQRASYVNEHYADIAELLKAMRGIGLTTCATLIAELPELGRAFAP